MPDAYSKPCQISKIMRHIENPEIEQLIQAYSGTFSNIQAYSGTSRHIQALLGHIEPYSGIFRTV